MSNKQNDEWNEARQEADAEKGIVRLYEIKRDSIIYEPCSDGSKYFRFKHLDGAYSFCETEKGGVVHLSANAPLKKHGNGYVLVDADHGKVDKSKQPMDTWDEYETWAEQMENKIKGMAYSDLEIQRDNYTEMVSEQLDDEHKKFLDILLMIQRELLIRERIHYGTTEPKTIRN